MHQELRGQWWCRFSANYKIQVFLPFQCKLTTLSAFQPVSSIQFQQPPSAFDSPVFVYFIFLGILVFNFLTSQTGETVFHVLRFTRIEYKAGKVLNFNRVGSFLLLQAVCVCLCGPFTIMECGHHDDFAINQLHSYKETGAFSFHSSFYWWFWVSSFGRLMKY